MHLSFPLRRGEQKKKLTISGPTPAFMVLQAAVNRIVLGVPDAKYFFVRENLPKLVRRALRRQSHGRSWNEETARARAVHELDTLGTHRRAHQAVAGDGTLPAGALFPFGLFRKPR